MRNQLCRVERYADEPDLFSRQLKTVGYSFAGTQGNAIISQLSDMHIADERIKYLGKSSFSSLLRDDSGFIGMLCYPAGLKTVWVHGEPVKSKLYYEFRVKSL